MAAQTFDPQMRRQGVGASEIGALLGKSSFKTPMELKQLKRGEIDDVAGEAARWGSELEDTIANLVEQDQGIKLRRQTKTHIHPEIPYLFCHLDRIMAYREGETCEIKTTVSQVYKSWLEKETGMPDHIWLQLQAQFACKPKIRRTLLAVAVLDQRKIHYSWVLPHPETISMIEEEVRYFWQECVLNNGVPRHLTMSDYQNVDPTENQLQASMELTEKFQQLQTLKDEIKFLQTQEKSLQLEIADEIKDYEEIVDDAGGWIARFKPSETKRLDTKRFKSEHPQLASEFETVSKTRSLRLNPKTIQSVSQFEMLEGS